MTIRRCKSLFCLFLCFLLLFTEEVPAYAEGITLSGNFPEAEPPFQEMPSVTMKSLKIQTCSTPWSQTGYYRVWKFENN